MSDDETRSRRSVLAAAVGVAVAGTATALGRPLHGRRRERRACPPGQDEQRHGLHGHQHDRRLRAVWQEFEHPRPRPLRPRDGDHGRDVRRVRLVREQGRQRREGQRDGDHQHAERRVWHHRGPQRQRRPRQEHRGHGSRPRGLWREPDEPQWARGAGQGQADRRLRLRPRDDRTYLRRLRPEPELQRLCPLRLRQRCRDGRLQQGRRRVPDRPPARSGPQVPLPQLRREPRHEERLRRGRDARRSRRGGGRAAGMVRRPQPGRPLSADGDRRVRARLRRRPSSRTTASRSPAARRA